MKQTKIIMGMPVTIEALDTRSSKKIFQDVFSYFKYIDKKFSTYKRDSEISKFNRKEIKKADLSEDVKKIFKDAEDAKIKTNGFFDIYNKGYCDPSGIVKGYAILNAAKMLKKAGYKNFYVEAGGDIQVSGLKKDKKWKIGIKNPFVSKQIVKVLNVYNKGVATSGNYLRGNHIYNPKTTEVIDEIVSITVIGQNILVADVLATAAFAMGKEGINFIENFKGAEGYMIDKDGVATFTSGLERYVN